jgi:hypothetical protein
MDCTVTESVMDCTVTESVMDCTVAESVMDCTVTESMWVFLKCKRICTGYCLIIHHHVCMPIANLGTCFPLAHVVVYLCVPIPNQDLVYHQHIPWSICVCLSQTRTLLSTSSCRGLFVCAYPKPGHCFPPAHVVVYLCVPIPNQDIAFHQLMSWSICVCLS